MKRLKLLALGITMAMGISAVAACAPDQTTNPTPENPPPAQTTGEVKAGTYAQTQQYFVGQQISVNFKQLFTNTTGKALAFTATPGSITSSGQWTWTPDKAGEFDVSITASVGEGEDIISDTLSFKLTVTAVDKIRGLKFRQTEQYRSGDEISVDVKPLFDKDADVGELTYTASFGTIANGVWTYTADKTGVLSPRITATSGSDDGVLDLYVTVTGGFDEAQSANVTLNTEEITVSDYTVKAGEQATISGRAGDYAETTLLVPAKEAEPVLTFLYKGVCPGSNGAPAPMLYAYDAESDELLAVLYNGVMAKSGGKGQGMGVDTGLNKTISWQPYAFELNRFFRLDEAKSVKFRFADGIKGGVINGEAIGTGTQLDVEMGGSSGTSASYAAVNVAAKASAGVIEAMDGEWTPLMNSQNNKVEKTEKGLKLTAKGAQDPTEDVAVAAVLLDNGESNLTDYKITVTGTGKYRIYAFAVDANNAGKAERATVAAFEYLRPGGYYNGNETSKGDLGWQQADEHGDVLWYPGSASIGNMHVALAVYMCASETDTYIDVSTGGEGVYASKSAVDLGAKTTFEDITYDFSANFYSVFNGVNTFVETYALSAGAPGSINPTTGVWTANLDKAGQKTFTVTCSAAQYSDEIQVTLDAQGRIIVDRFAPEKSEYALGETLSVDFSEYVKNSTDEAVTYSVNYGEINQNTGEYTFKPTSGGIYEIKVLVQHSTGDKSIDFTVQFKGNITVSAYDGKGIYDIGKAQTVDFSKYFSCANKLTYSVEGNLGTIDPDSGVFTFTPAAGGIIPVAITANDATTGEKAVLNAEVCVKAKLENNKDDELVTVNAEPVTIGTAEFTAGEQATAKKGGEIKATLSVPSSDRNPVLTLLYKGHTNVKVCIEVYKGSELLCYLYKNDASNASDSGLGVKGSGVDARIQYQILAFELNNYFELAETTELTFVFKVPGGNDGCELYVANVAVVPESYLTSASTDDGKTWKAMYDNADNKMAVNGNTMRLDVKGVEGGTEDSVMGAYNTYVFTAADGTNAKNLKLWVKGNAQYRIVYSAIYTGNTTQEPGTSNKNNAQVTRIFVYGAPGSNFNNYTNYGDETVYYSGWNTADPDGRLVWYYGSTNIQNTQLTIYVMVRASEQDTWLEVCESKNGTGTYSLTDELNLAVKKNTAISMEFTCYMGFAGEGATFSLEGENCGTISTAGAYSFTPTEGGKYTFTVKATKGETTISLPVTISVEGELQLGEFEAPWQNGAVGSELTNDFGPLLTNTTGYPVTWEATYGSFEDSVWTYTPDAGGNITITVTAKAQTPFGEKSASLEFTINVKSLVEATGEYKQTADIVAGTAAELDFDGLFTYNGAGQGELTYSLDNAEEYEGATFNGSKLTVTFKNGGINVLQVKAEQNGQSALLTVKVSVHGIFTSANEKAEVSKEDTVISGRTYKAGEVVTLTDGDGVSATQTINIPATEDHPYLYFYYKGKGHPKVFVSITDKSGKEYVLFTGDKADPKYGRGMGIGTKANQAAINTDTVWLLNVIDLTLVDGLNIAAPETFTFTVKDVVPSTDAYYRAGDNLCFAGVRAITAEELGGSGNIGNFGSNGLVKVENAELIFLNNDENVTLSTPTEKSVKLDIKGVEGNKDTTTVLFYSYIATSKIYGREISLFIKGNASYRVQHLAVNKATGAVQNSRWLESGVYAAGDGNDYDMEWYTAQEKGNWHATNTGRGYDGCRVTVIVMVRASEQDTWLEVTSGFDAPEGVYLRSGEWDNTVRYDNNTGAVKFTAGTAGSIRVFTMFYGVKGGEGSGSEKVTDNAVATNYTFEVMKDGQVTSEYGTVTAGVWSHTFAEAGTYEFVIRGKLTINGNEYYADLNMKITVT